MAKESIEEIFRQFEQSNPRQQSDKIYSVEGKISEDNIGSTNVQLSFLQPDLTTRSVAITSARLCDCGRLISQNTLQGKCQHRGCSRYVCAECSRTCCGRILCPRHYKEGRNGRVYCSRCRIIVWLKLFFDIGERTEK